MVVTRQTIINVYPTMDAMQPTAYIAMKIFPEESKSTTAATGKQIARPYTTTM